jgi:hypothetical protein
MNSVKICDTKLPAYLLIFDHRSKVKDLLWEDRISWKKEGAITVLGC